MKAYCTLLTHFSQRYPKLPVLNEKQNVGVAFDFLSLDSKHLELYPLLLPYLQQLFKDDESEGDDKDNKEGGGKKQQHSKKPKEGPEKSKKRIKLARNK
jgi:ribonuclease Z